MRAILLFLILATHLHGAGLGVYNPAQHAVNGFMPTQLPGLVFWLDSQRQTGLTNGQDMQLNDFSGAAGNFTNATASARPTFNSSLFNGRACARFDGVDDALILKKSITYTQHTVFIAFRHDMPNGTANRSRIYGAATASLNDYQVNYPIVCLLSDTTNKIASWITSQNYGNADLKKNELCIFTSLLKTDGSFTNYTFGKAGAGHSVGAKTATFTKHQIAASFDPSDVPSAFSKCDIAEIIVFSQAHTIEIQNQVERYLGTKYGIVVQ